MVLAGWRKKIPAWIVLVLLSLIVSSTAGFAAGPKTLVLSNVTEPPLTTADHTGFLDVVATEAFRRIGVHLRLIKLPAERGLLLANEGYLDGDLTRIAGLNAQYPNLVRVPEKLIDWDFVAFSRNPSIPANFAVLRKYSVGLIRGWKIYERAMAGSKDLTTVNNPEQLFRLLDLNRIDVALYMRLSGLALIQKMAIPDIHVLKPVLARRPMYMYLNRRDIALVPKLAAALRGLKRDGFYDRVYREKLTRYDEVSRK